MPMCLLFICCSASFCASSGIMMCLPFIIIPSITACSSMNVKNGLSSCEISFLLMGQPCMIYSFLSIFRCSSWSVAWWILHIDMHYEIPLLYVLHQCLFSCWVFYHTPTCADCLNWKYLHGSVVTSSLLWISLVQVCIGWFCIVRLLVVYIEISAIVLLHLFWILLPMGCGLLLYLPLRQSNSGEISLVNVWSLMHLCVAISFFCIW